MSAATFQLPSACFLIKQTEKSDRNNNIEVCLHAVNLRFRGAWETARGRPANYHTKVLNFGSSNV